MPENKEKNCKEGNLYKDQKDFKKIPKNRLTSRMFNPNITKESGPN